MLKIWYYGGTEYMNDAPAYFDNVYEDEWIEDAFVKEMIQDVDHSAVISAHIIESPVLGAITPKDLSGGVKVLILMLKDDSFVYNLSNCGNNCAKWVLKIAESKDLTVYLQHISRSFFADSSIHTILFCSLLLRLLSFDFSLCILLAQAGQYFDMPEPGTYSTPHTIQCLAGNAVHRFVGVICNSPTKPMNL